MKLETTDINMKSFWKQLKERWSATTPKFWKKIQEWMIGIGSSAVAVLGADKMFDLTQYGIHPVVFTVCGYVIVFCAAIGLASKITKVHNWDDDDDV